MRLSGGGDRQRRDDKTPRLIKSKINDERASEIPVVTSCKGVPLTGLVISRSTNAQQFIIAKIVSIINPDGDKFKI